jgi:hypothetical protein
LLLRQTCQLRRKYAAGKARWTAAENEKDGYLGQSLKTCNTILHLFGDRNVQCCKVCIRFRPGLDEVDGVDVAVFWDVLARSCNNQALFQAQKTVHTNPWAQGSIKSRYPD